MTEGKEGAELTCVKTEMLTQEIRIKDEMGLQALPLVYHQNIVVEVPVINGEPPAVLHSSRNTDEFSNLEHEKIYGAASESDDSCKGIGLKQSEQECILLSIQREERIRRRREQNRFRMRALRASDSEVAKRLRENNKFRMRMLRASGSQVAEGIRERNKYRMREVRSAESQSIRKCADTSLDAGEYLQKDQFKLNFCLEGRQDISNIERDLVKVELSSDVNFRTEENKLTCSMKEEMEEKFLNDFHSEQSPKQNLNDKSVSIISNEPENNIEQPSSNSVCKSDTADCHYNSVIINRGEQETPLNPHNSNSEEESKMCEMQDSQCCMQCGVSETCIHDGRGNHILHTGGHEVSEYFSTNFFSKMGQFHKINIQNDILSKQRSFTHFMRVEKLPEQHDLVKDISLIVNETPSDIDDQRKRRESGKLRMRLKRHCETEEEAQRRRERGRLRMRVLRASESEEQAARRRELNRLRMRMKRSSVK